MDHSEICGKQEFNDNRTWTNNVIDQQSQLRITCDVTDLIPNWTLSQNIGGQDKGIKRPNSSELSFCCVRKSCTQHTEAEETEKDNGKYLGA